MTRKHNIVVVGNGLFGSIAATYARHCGHSVTVVSEARPYAASPASGCVLAPSWLSSLEKSDIADAMALLGVLYTIHEVDFKTNFLKRFKAKRIDPKSILVKPDIDARVVSVADGVVKYAEPKSAGTQNVGTLRGDVLVAAGIWCGELLTGLPPIKGLYGASLRVPGQLIEPKINAYAPYRQAVGFNLDARTVWFGDGTALIEKSWKSDREARIRTTRDRASTMMGNKGLGQVTSAKVIEGARPYVEGHKSGYLRQLSPKLWVSTGGAKNGTVLAALQALRFVEALK